MTGETPPPVVDDGEPDDSAAAVWLGPRASEGEMVEPVAKKGRGLTMRAMIPNAITAAALCSGLTGIRFAIEGDWERALFAIVLAGVLDALDGRMARALKAQSRFGAELDSLADSLSFGMAPALVLFLWSLQDLPRLGWFAALGFAICCALRLARFNAQIDTEDQPHKSAGFITGVPAPVGAGLAFLPMFLWLASGQDGRCWRGSPRGRVSWFPRRGHNGDKTSYRSAPPRISGSGSRLPRKRESDHPEFREQAARRSSW